METYQKLILSMLINYMNCIVIIHQHQEKLEINRDMLSKYSSNIENIYEIKIVDINKLAPNLDNKSKHILHYRNFQLYLSLGMKLVSFQRIPKFKQSDQLVNNTKDYKRYERYVSKPSFVSQKIYSKNFVVITFWF